MSDQSTIDKKEHHNHDHDHDHDHGSGDAGAFHISKEWLSAIISFVLLITGIAFDYMSHPAWFDGWIRFVWYLVAYVPVGIPVLLKGVRLALRGQVFTEFLLMSIATIGAFYIREFPEGVAVMLFYSVGELFQDAAVNRAKRSIKALLDVRPEKATVLRNGQSIDVDPTSVKVDEIIQIKVGERVPLDGALINDSCLFSSAALTGESRPSTISAGEKVLAGMVNEEKVVQVKVTKLFQDSSLARILTLVQNATGRKARTELFIRRFARIYTPIVVLLAALLTFLPYFFVEQYVFNDWLYRALIFLVVSCPCALVVAIPLGYFGGIGAGSRNGILFKGSNYLDLMTRIDTVVMDKTGTLTKGVFEVQQTIDASLSKDQWLPLLIAIESHSNHPIAKAIAAYAKADGSLKVSDVKEIKGHGVEGFVDGKKVLAGNLRLMNSKSIAVDASFLAFNDTLVLVAVDDKLAGGVVIADQLKPDSAAAVRQLNASGIRTILLSGDKQAVVNDVAKELGIVDARGDLLPEDKVKFVEDLKRGKKEPVVFVGDGINDAPVLALSDVGMAMGGIGSDAAIETADVVIQTDQPTKIFTAIQIGKATNQIVWQNIIMAMSVKVVVLALGAGGLSTMWEAVFADVGVALLAILNAIRIQRMKF